jgi:geranylgeranyl diphosphate synthase type I
MTLVHDDIEDQSELRRGKPCIHKIYGVPNAINAGDAMLIKVFEIANSSNIPAERCQRLIAKIADRAYGITWGQAFEFSMWKRKNFTEDDVIRLLRHKTGALTGLSTEGGAIAGGGSQEQLEILGEFGETVGVAFQIVDHLLKAASPQDKKVFGRLLGKKNVKKNEIREVIGLYEKYGSTGYAKTQAEAFLENAMKALNRLPPSEARNSLSSIADFLVSRSF